MKTSNLNSGLEENENFTKRASYASLDPADRNIYLQNYSSFCLENIKAAPQPNGYRNKVEYTVGNSLEGIPTVGFNIASFRRGCVAIGEPIGVLHIAQVTERVRKAFQDFIRQSSLPVYDEVQDKGVWRNLLVRSSERMNQILVMVVACTKHFPDGPLDISFQKEINALKNFLISPEEPNLTIKDTSSSPDHVEEGSKCSNIALDTNGSWLGITSLFIATKNIKNADIDPADVSLLWGKDYLEESLLGLTFKVSRDAFFQVNTVGAEQLYSEVIKHIPEGSILLDVCCGTGTIGMCCAKKKEIKSVIGVDCIESSIKDAKLNAERNGVSNATFICSMAEKVMGKMCEDVEKSSTNSSSVEDSISRPNEENDTDLISCNDKKSQTPTNSDISPPVVAVVDPPRSGLHCDVLRAIRKCPLIQRLVYVSCNPTGSLVRDAVQLCGQQSSKWKGNPFRPVRATPVDMFPHTNHCEMVMVFERLSDIDEQIEKRMFDERGVMRQEDKRSKHLRKYTFWQSKDELNIQQDGKRKFQDCEERETEIEISAKRSKVMDIKDKKDKEANNKMLEIDKKK